ncbi:MAG: DivIVA domain-containing protein [Actinomycetales bacterium]
MPLTPEDVISKTFQATRFAEGYNQDEVDDFLDEVVSTLRSLNTQIDDLESKVRISQSEVERLQSEGTASESAAAVSMAKPESSPAESTSIIDAGMAGLAAGTEGDASSAAGMLLLAQRLHDEHVRNGQNQRDQLIAEARARADKLIADAEENRTSTLSTLELERDQLQSFIDGLRVHEQEYRARMRSFLQAQLSDLDSQQSLEPDAAPI